jgi:nicotine oxidoreductase
MIPGLIPDTLDGLNSEWINQTIREMKDESFQFRPARRIMIPKANGKMRPLTIASPRDQIVQQVMLFLLEAIFEPTFSQYSHGFRPNKGCHTAIKQVLDTFNPSRWVIEGDIKACFDSIDHEILIKLISNRIKDIKFINLIKKALKVGYGENGKILSQNIIGTPQGSVISPI